jgi:uncharacterized flavoprotein (TIGR03862 family)
MLETERCDALVIGGGPAGLRAAEVISAAGRRTILADHKPSVGRKFLVAGRGGLNLTHSEPVDVFRTRYGDRTVRWRKFLRDFSPDDLRAWAHGLGIETFVGTSGRVFPITKQAAPLLRRWIARLREQDVSFRARHALAGFARTPDRRWRVTLTAPRGEVAIEAQVVIFALGGASWPETGSDAAWTKLFAEHGIPLTPFVPSNCGYEVDWPAAFIAEADGLPLKNIVVRAGGESIAGELLITKYGLEGGALYQLGRTLRAMAQPALVVDLKPSFTVEQLMEKVPGTEPDLRGRAIRSWKLSPAAAALLRWDESSCSPLELGTRAKNYQIRLRGPRPIAEAISSAGGVPWPALDDSLMLRSHSGLFCAGEMIDWDAPTGGYLLQGCFATATWAARGALVALETCAPA